MCVHGLCRQTAAITFLVALPSCPTVQQQHAYNIEIVTCVILPAGCPHFATGDRPALSVCESESVSESESESESEARAVYLALDRHGPSFF